MPVDRWGGLSPHYGAYKGHGPEVGFAYTLHNDPQFKPKDEQILLIKVTSNPNFRRDIGADVRVVISPD